MKKTFRIFALCLMPYALCLAAHANVPGAGAMNNNHWNQMAGNRAAPPAADFGNCNALIIRCATPRCANGGCADMQVATAIVNGCLQANDTCRIHGDALVQSIAAQMVANSSVRANDAAAQQAAAAQAAQAAAAQQQAQAMQQQMAQQQEQMANQMQMMQQQMMQSQQESNQRMEQVLAAQQATQQIAQATAPAQPAAAVPVTDSVAQVSAANNMAADLLARQQHMGMINAELDKVKAAMRNLTAVMQTTFEYAGCDSRGDNCTGPRRVAKFRQLAGGFFDPFDNVLDSMLTALEMASALGVEVSAIYMLLEGSCTRWGLYWCDADPISNFDVANPMANNNANRCRLMRPLANNEDVLQTLMDTSDNNSRQRVGCMSNVLQRGIFARHAQRRQQNSDIRTLEMMITTRESATANINDGPNFCRLTADNKQILEAVVQSRQLPPNICFTGQRTASSANITIAAPTVTVDTEATVDPDAGGVASRFIRMQEENARDFVQGSRPLTEAQQNQRTLDNASRFSDGLVIPPIRRQ